MSPCRAEVELATEGGHVGVDRGFLTVTSATATGKVALDDIEAVIASAQGLTYSNAALAALAERGAPLVVCGRDYAPAAVLMPMNGHFQQGIRMAAQACAAKPVGKRLWAAVVRAKILAQAEALIASAQAPPACGNWPIPCAPAIPTIARPRPPGLLASLHGSAIFQRSYGRRRQRPVELRLRRIARGDGASGGRGGITPVALHSSPKPGRGLAPRGRLDGAVPPRRRSGRPPIARRRPDGTQRRRQGRTRGCAAPGLPHGYRPRAPVQLPVPPVRLFGQGLPERRPPTRFSSPARSPHL